MKTSHYFAYGSNMLTSRLHGRCQSASLITVAKAFGHRLDFSKPSIDGSGKASMVQDDADQVVFGAVFEISANELKTLDDFEGPAYERCDFTVTCIRTGREIDTCTYMALEQEDGLMPYDWYLALLIAGLTEHGIDSDYASTFRSISYEIDTKAARKQRRAAIAAFERAGIDDYRTLL